LVQQVLRIYCDNQSAIFLAKNPTYHSKIKHIDIQYHFVRDMVEEKKVLLMKVYTLNNVADSLTKYVSTEKFSWCRGSMGIVSLAFLEFYRDRCKWSFWGLSSWMVQTICQDSKLLGLGLLSRGIFYSGRLGVGIQGSKHVWALF
jgi:hypothetical protein